VQPSPHGWGCQLRGDLAQQLYQNHQPSDPQRSSTSVFELVDDVVDLVVAEVHDRAQKTSIVWRPITAAASTTRDLRAGAFQPGVNGSYSVGHTGLTECVDDLFVKSFAPSQRAATTARSSALRPGPSAVISASV
jgi:hypothetical protein